ncbi:hypothetical protein M9H77_12022 [Catharanthus roseus]|uniref:Uncharacterized protein n=1 Tax=Catharanthus roseus TaxID=4058 RepID=A0ACC0BGB4_CATRO|nr:hypothetical protein M9H77_12022 [Catharanthus roseus]
MLNCKEHISKSPHAQPDKNWIDIVNIVAATIKPYRRFNHVNTSSLVIRSCGTNGVPALLGCDIASDVKSKVNVGASPPRLSNGSCGTYELGFAHPRQLDPMPLSIP